jgi:hypothetical protein
MALNQLDVLVVGGANSSSPRAGRATLSAIEQGLPGSTCQYPRGDLLAAC